MKFLVLIAVIYMAFRLYTLSSKVSSIMGNEKEKINTQPDSDEGEYIDYEEVE